MLYFLLEWLNQQYDIPGFGVFQYLTFRAILAVFFSLIISLLLGKRVINLLRRNLIGEVVRDSKFGPDHASKAGTPTMGGLIIVAAIVIPTLLWADITSGYVWLILLGTLWMGAIGFVDDYIKVFKKDKKGLKSVFKLLGQISLGVIVGLVMLFHPDFMGSRTHITGLNKINPDAFLRANGFERGDELLELNGDSFTGFPSGNSYGQIGTYKVQRQVRGGVREERIISIPADSREEVAETLFGPKNRSFVYITDFPFFKNYHLDYSHIPVLRNLISRDTLGRIVFLLVVIFIITAVSNAVNLTDGLDGLAAGTAAIVGAGLAVFVYVAGNARFSDYLNVTYIPLSAELFLYAAALIGACMGFLWYNAFPAQVFMGDTGSLALGGAIGIMAVMVKKELLLPILCGVFFAETVSVMMQVSYFRYTKRKYGEGRRIFRMSPLHHHYEKLGYHEAKIVMRFFIVAILLVLTSFATLKLR